MSHRGAGTRACRAGTHPGACTGPTIRFGARRNAGFHRIVLDVAPDASEFGVVANPMVVRLGLPERRAGASQNLIRLANSHTLQGTQQSRRCDFREDKNMDVVCHQNPRAEIVMAKSHPTIQALNHNLGDLLVLQIRRPLSGSIQIPIHPDKSLTRSHLSRRRESGARQASVQVPRSKQPLSINVLVRQTATRYTHEPVVQTLPALSHTTAMRRDESRRGRHECLRHEVIT